jgi:hypothetical protein
VPATSRPLRVAPAPGSDAQEAAPLPAVDRMALAAGIAQHMRAEDLALLLRFVESPRDGTLVLVKQDGRIVDAQVHRAPRLGGAAQAQ